jgi:hypothetical protein
MIRARTLMLALAIAPSLVFAEGGPGDMPLGDPEELETRTFESTVRRDFESGRFVVKEGRARFALPDAASALSGRTVKVEGVVGESLGRGVRELNDLTWIEPRPENRQGTLVSEDGQPVLVVGEERISLSPPAGLSSNALLFLAGRSDVPVSGFLYPAEERDELVVSGITGRIAELEQGDAAYLSQRTRADAAAGEEDGVRYDFQSALDEQGRRQALASGTPVKVTDLEIYRLADRETESVGRFRQIPASFKLDDLAENERLFAYVVRLDRNRNPGDPQSEGWIPLRKVKIGETLGDKLLEIGAELTSQLLKKWLEEPEQAGGGGLSDVVSELDSQAQEQGLPAEGTPAEVSADKLLLRDGANGRKLAIMFDGLALELTGERKGDWLGVRMIEPLDGWVDTRYLEIDGHQAVVANTSRLNLRAEASTRSDVRLVLVEGFELEIAERQGKWARVQTPGPLEGFAHEEFLTH